MARPDIAGRQIGREAFTIDEFCFSHGISRATFYNLQKDGEAPDTIRARGRVLISAESARRWRKRLTVRRHDTQLAVKPEEKGAGPVCDERTVQRGDISPPRDRPLSSAMKGLKTDGANLLERRHRHQSSKISLTDANSEKQTAPEDERLLSC